MCSEWEKTEARFPVIADNASDTAYVTFTSGSSGEPKGVVTSFGALRHFVGAALQRYRIVASDRVLCFAPLTFDTSVEELFVSVAAGATLVFRSEEMLDSVEFFLEECARLDISVLDLPTSYFHEIALAVSYGKLKLPGWLANCRHRWRSRASGSRSAVLPLGARCSADQYLWAERGHRRGDKCRSFAGDAP